MPNWAVAAALIAVLGYFAFKKPSESKSTLNPKEAFEKGKKDGSSAALKDKSEGKSSRVSIPYTDLDNILKNPDSWMHDEVKAYELGFNLGYLDEYLPKLTDAKTTKIKTEKKSDVDEKELEEFVNEIPKEKPENWPKSCKWPPSSLDEMDAVLERLHDWEASSEGTMGVSRRKPSWLPDEYWPPICPPDGWPTNEAWPPKKSTYEDWKSGKLSSSKSVIKRAFSDLSTGITRTIQELKFGKCEGALGDLGDYKIKYISDVPPDFKSVLVSAQVRSMIKGDSYDAVAFDYWSDLLDKEAFVAALNGDKSSSNKVSRVARCLRRERVKRFGLPDPSDKLGDEQKYPGIRSLPNNPFKKLAVKVVSKFYYPAIFEGVVAPSIQVFDLEGNKVGNDYATIPELRYFASVCREFYSNNEAGAEFDAIADHIERMGRGKNASGSGISEEDVLKAIEIGKKAYDVYSALSGEGEEESSSPKSFEFSGSAEGSGSITLGTRMSPEWVNRVPSWYYHSSFKKMNKG